jgi:DNA polymerase (family 10)
MKFGVITARRGWVEKKDVINTLPTEQFLASLRAKPGAAKGKTAKRKSA